MISIDLLTVAKKITNYDVDATAGGLWTSDKIYQVTVPAGKRWFLVGGFVGPDVSSTCVINAYNAGAGVIFSLANAAAGTARVAFPSGVSATQHGNYGGHVVLDTGEYVRATLGTSQTGGAEASCVVLEVDV